MGLKEGISDLEVKRIGSDTPLSGSFFIAGAAFWANTTDLRLNLNGKQTVKTISFDLGEIMASPYDDVKKRQLYYAGKYGGFNDLNDDGNPFVTIDSSGMTVTNDSEWEDAPGSGFASNYILASDPSKLVSGMAKAFAGINKPVATSSGFALSTNNLVFSGAGAYTASFNPYRWSGSVTFRKLSFDALTGVLSVSSPPVWDAAIRLDAALAALGR